jgi:two-component system, NarL family, sensor histidine kinase ComP
MKKNLIRSLFLAFLILQIWSLFLTFRYPVIGVNVRENNNNQWEIKGFDSTSISDVAQLEVGDIILSINGNNANEYRMIERWRTLDQADSILVERNGQTLNILTQELSFFSASDLLSFSAEFFSLLIAFLLYKKVEHSSSSRYLSAVFLDIALIFISLPASNRGDLVGKFCISTFMLLLPLIFYQFLKAFLAEKGSVRLPDIFLKVLGSLVSVSIIMNFFYYIVTPKFFSYHHYVIVSTLAISVIGISADFIILIFASFTQKDKKSYVSTIIKTVFWSLFLSLSPIVFFSFVPHILFGHEWLNSLYMSWFIFVFPLTFVYLLATRRLYDIDMIVRRILFTLMIAAVPSLFFTMTMRLFFPHDATAEKLVLVFLLHLSGITFVLYSLENLTTKLMSSIFPRKYMLQEALKKISRNLGAVSSQREMKDIILVDIVETLEVTGGAIVYQYKDTVDVILEGRVNQAEVEQLIASGDWEHSDYSVFEVSRQEEYTSYLVMTQKKTNTYLGGEEVQWLSMIITYLAVSLENLHLIRKLNQRLQQLSSLLPDEEEAQDLVWFRKLMFELQEKERVRIATDLHDTTMQDLFFLKGKLRNLQERYSYTKEDRSTLTGLMDYIDIINMNLRQSCFELHPYLLKEIGLVGTLHKLIHSEQAVSPFEIELFTSEVGSIETKDMETKRHLFRMVQELLNNAKKHSQAQSVRIALYMHKGTLFLQYEDDGVGFEQNRMPAREIGSSGMGLEQMKSRILALGGRYELQSGTGQGMKLLARLPGRESKSA